MAAETQQEQAYRMLSEALAACKGAKPNDRSAQDRAFAVVITDLEKVIAYYNHWIVCSEDNDRY